MPRRLGNAGPTLPRPQGMDFKGQTVQKGWNELWSCPASSSCPHFREVMVGLEMSLQTWAPGQGPVSSWGALELGAPFLGISLSLQGHPNIRCHYSTRRSSRPPRRRCDDMGVSFPPGSLQNCQDNLRRPALVHYSSTPLHQSTHHVHVGPVGCAGPCTGFPQGTLSPRVTLPGVAAPLEPQMAGSF